MNADKNRLEIQKIASGVGIESLLYIPGSELWLLDFGFHLRASAEICVPVMFFGGRACLSTNMNAPHVRPSALS